MATTPPIEALTTDVVSSSEQHPTPVKARIQGTIDYLEAYGIQRKRTKIKVFEFNNVSQATGYRLLKSLHPRTLKNTPNQTEKSSRNKVITKEQLDEMVETLETTGIEGRALTWEQLGLEAD